jgi:hypothetical protein
MGENGDNSFNNQGDNYYYNNYNYNRVHNQLDLHVTMANTALALGIASIPLCFFLNIGIIIGGIAIVMAILSKGVMNRLLPQARRAIIFGVVGIVLGYGIFIYDMYSVLTDATLRQQLNIMSEQMNGISFDEMLKELGVNLQP